MRAATVTLLVAVSLAVCGSVAAQFGQFGRGRFGPELRYPTPESFDGRFNFCRIIFRQNPYGDGNGWGVDYPRADENLSIRLSELTKVSVSFDKSGEPQHVLLRLTDDALFRCPFIMMTEVGALSMTDDEAARLRTYLLKGGFLWADDFWGAYAWEAWMGQIRKALPPGEFPIIDTPIDHALFRTLFDVQHLPQIPSIDWWAETGTTSERGADSTQQEARAILDKNGRIMVFITHNTDFGDAFEREGDDPRYFYKFSVDGYAVGIDLLLYAMTH